MRAPTGPRPGPAVSDWKTDAGARIKWGVDCMSSRYGGPCGARSCRQANSYYY
ncbi:hypothetical protein [Streptomyces sp. NPDC058382]|uniref:hypothetical protein n=1 Tax=unclassified Streptomyces TaxID=2593676 RepID=UPI00362C2FEC